MNVDPRNIRIEPMGAPRLYNGFGVDPYGVLKFTRRDEAIVGEDAPERYLKRVVADPRQVDIAPIGAVRTYNSVDPFELGLITAPERLLGEYTEVEKVDAPEKARAGSNVSVKATLYCHASWLLNCEAYAKFIRHDTGQVVRVPPSEGSSCKIDRNKSAMFVMPTFKMPNEDLTVTVEPWEEDPWNPDDKGTPVDTTILLAYTAAAFRTVVGEYGPFAPGSRGKIVEWSVENAGNERGIIYIRCIGPTGNVIDGWSSALDPGKSVSGSFAATLPSTPGSYSYTIRCWGQDQLEGLAQEDSWIVKVEEGAPPPEPPGQKPMRDPLDTLIYFVEEHRPAFPIEGVNTAISKGAEFVIKATPPINILPT